MRKRDSLREHGFPAGALACGGPQRTPNERRGRRGPAFAGAAGGRRRPGPWAGLGLGLLLAGGLPALAAAQVSFAPEVHFATGTSPAAVATADLNGDGKPDLVVANANANTVSVFLGTGTGSFGAKTDFATGTGPYGVAIADVMRDVADGVE